MQRQLAPSGNRLALHHRDSRLRHSLEGVEDVLDLGERDRAARGARRRHLTEV